MLPSDEIIELYRLYGFELESKEKGYLVFCRESGFFQNVEIVILDPTLKKEDVHISQYEQLGYAVHISKFTSVAQAHDTLFQGFFKVKLSNQKLIREYSNFCTQQSEKLKAAYEYISGTFMENGVIQNVEIVQRIQHLFGEDERQLILLEASAGYGKTCTSYEVVQQLVSSFSSNITILTELSKNRTARIFQYVLLSEIDQKFPTLSSRLVTHEITCGRVFLVIDGFDELLSKKYDSPEDKQEDAQTMLDTIARLLRGDSKAKILLTSRKSSIFVGRDFDKWIEQSLTECNVTRLLLLPPSPEEWINEDKLAKLRENQIVLNDLINPVLLTHLRNASLDDFDKKYNSNHAVIIHYLTLLLNREQDRQALRMSTSKQLEVMEQLAAQMVQYDISSESVDAIEAILSDIIEPDFYAYQKQYEAPDVPPTEAEFLNKLAHHALLDRISSQKNEIGFLNEFIFGFMIAEAVCNKYLPASELAGKYLDFSITAYATEDLERRTVFYNRIHSVLAGNPIQRRLNAAIRLNGVLDDVYQNEYLDNFEFEGVSITLPEQFQECFFYGCVFDGCTIDIHAFKDCQFNQCSFFNVTLLGYSATDRGIAFFLCHGHEEFEALACQECENKELPMDYERKVLEQFWKPGYETAEPRRADDTMMKGIAPQDRPAVSRAIESLIKKGILTTKLHSFYLNFDKMDEIRKILQRKI